MGESIRVGKGLLTRVKEYIEQREEKIEGEWGNCRSLKKLIADGDMPDVYFEVLKLIDLIEFFPEFGSTDPIAWANAVLSRWGSQTPKPIPLSERLPEATDCDGQGRCWIFRYEDPECKGLFEWEYRVLDLSTDDWLPPVMCWLPYYSMPFPKYD